MMTYCTISHYIHFNYFVFMLYLSIYLYDFITLTITNNFYTSSWQLNKTNTLHLLLQQLLDKYYDTLLIVDDIGVVDVTHMIIGPCKVHSSLRRRIQMMMMCLLTTWSSLFPMSNGCCNRRTIVLNRLQIISKIK